MLMRVTQKVYLIVHIVECVLYIGIQVISINTFAKN
jgi:hypothetical protein